MAKVILFSLYVFRLTTSRKHRFRRRLLLGYSSSLPNKQKRVSRRILFKLPLCFSRTRKSESFIPAVLQKVEMLKSQVCKNDPGRIRSSAVPRFRQLKLGDTTKKTYCLTIQYVYTNKATNTTSLTSREPYTVLYKLVN